MKKIFKTETMMFLHKPKANLRLENDEKWKCHLMDNPNSLLFKKFEGPVCQPRSQIKECAKRQL